jgi:hypothetical protein
MRLFFSLLGENVTVTAHLCTGPMPCFSTQRNVAFKKVAQDMKSTKTCGLATADKPKIAAAQQSVIFLFDRFRRPINLDLRSTATVISHLESTVCYCVVLGLPLNLTLFGTP